MTAPRARATGPRPRSFVPALAALAVVGGLIAWLVGPSDKPDVTTAPVLITSVTDELADAGDAPQPDLITGDAGARAADAVDPADAVDSELSAAAATPTPLALDLEPIDPGPEPTAPPAVEPPPTVLTESAASADNSGEPASDSPPAATVPQSLEPATAPAAATSSISAAGSSTAVETSLGSFFTRADEEAGASVALNQVELVTLPDGTGTFSGSLDMLWPGGAVVVLRLEGTFTWSPSSPQVEAIVTGSYRVDGHLDRDTEVTTTASLSITSFAAGSGSVCSSHCFGFTF